jgi:small subunit ribosomal protein S6
VATQVYEGMFILDPNHYAKDSAGTSGQVNDILTRLGGEILVSRLWDERKLAYPIDGHRKGTYWLTYFRLDSDKLAALDREFHLNESVLRKLVLRIDPRLVDALVEHAKTGATPEGRAPELGPARIKAPPTVAAAAAALAEMPDDL